MDTPKIIYVTITEFDASWDSYGNKISHYYATATYPAIVEHIVEYTTTRRSQRGYADYHEGAMAKLCSKIKKEWKLENFNILPNPLKPTEESRRWLEKTTHWILLAESLLKSWENSAALAEITLLQKEKKNAENRLLRLEELLQDVLQGKIRGEKELREAL